MPKKGIPVERPRPYLQADKAPSTVVRSIFTERSAIPMSGLRVIAKESQIGQKGGIQQPVFVTPISTLEHLEPVLEEIEEDKQAAEVPAPWVDRVIGNRLPNERLTVPFFPPTITDEAVEVLG